MQMMFGFLSDDLAHWKRKLTPLREGVELLPLRPPVLQLIKSIISSRTLDAVSQAAFDRLMEEFGETARIADAAVAHVEEMIAGVTFASDKAGYVIGALQGLRASRYGFDLDPLGAQPLMVSLAFLETLPGVGRKVSASTLNASTLEMPVMIVDGHVLRALQRLGAVRPRADHRIASEEVTSAMRNWNGTDFLDFHVSMKLFGQTICLYESPECWRCPFASDCPGKA